MTAYEACQLAAGDRIWARMPEGREYHRVTAYVEYVDEDMVTFDSGWGTLRLPFSELVDVDIGRIV